MIKKTINSDTSEYLIPDSFPLQVVALFDQPIFTAVQLTNATPKSILKKHSVLTIIGLRWSENGVPFLKSEIGYLKADRETLMAIKSQIQTYLFDQVSHILVVTPTHYYSDVVFNDKTRLPEKTKRGQILAVESIEWTQTGIPRLKTTQGYVTANKAFMSLNRKPIAYTKKLASVLFKKIKSATFEMGKMIRHGAADVSGVMQQTAVPFVKRVFNKIQRVYFRSLYSCFSSMNKIRPNRILFLSDSRNDLSGNFQYIVEEIEKQGLDAELLFCLKKTNNEKRTFREYTQLAWQIATSRYVILDDFYPLVYPLKMRSETDLIQVWHAVGAFKTFGFSRVGKPGGPNPDSKNHRNYDYAIVSSTNVAPYYAEGFGIAREKVLPLGAPRTDLFFDDQKKQNSINTLHDELPFVKNKKVILFAPTFRGDGQQTAHYPYEWLDFEAIYNHFSSEDFVFLLKIHPFVKNKLEIPDAYADFFYDVSDYREINDLLLISDVLVTDYSSVVFEYSLLKKKSIFFTPDLEEYTQSRDFYVDFDEFVPGPIVRNTEALIQEIENYETFSEQQLDHFLNYYFDDLDGKASKRFVDALTNGFDHVSPYKQ